MPPTQEPKREAGAWLAATCTAEDKLLMATVASLRSDLIT